jgi:hypothetical protein
MISSLQLTYSKIKMHSTKCIKYFNQVFFASRQLYIQIAETYFEKKNQQKCE